MLSQVDHCVTPMIRQTGAYLIDDSLMTSDSNYIIDTCVEYFLSAVKVLMVARFLFYFIVYLPYIYKQIAFNSEL